MEEVERERAAFAAARNQQKADDMARKTAAGMPVALDRNRSVFGDTMSSGQESGQGILNMLLEGGRGGASELDGLNSGMGDMALHIPLPAVVPPEASPSKFATSRAGRWFSAAAEGSQSVGLPFGDSGGSEIPAAVANLWGSPTPATRPSEAHENAPLAPSQAPPGPPPGNVGMPQQGAGMMQADIFMARPAPGLCGGGDQAQGAEKHSTKTSQSTLSQLLNIQANASPQPPSTPTQGSLEQQQAVNLPTPVAPLARPGNR